MSERFRVSIPKVIWFSTIVEADDEDAAIDEAQEMAPCLCARCSGWGQKWSIDEDEWGADGGFPITVERVSGDE